jgi:hypothetical protein
MARDGTGVDGTGDALGRLRAQLNDLYQSAGRPTYRQLRDHAARSGSTLPTSTSHELLTGTRMPRWATVETFVTACLGHATSRRPSIAIVDDDRDLRVWQQRHGETDQDLDHREAVPAARPAEGRRTRRGPDRWQICVDFILALDTAHNALREISRARLHVPDRRVNANRAVQDSGLYAEREKLLASGSPEVVTAGESVFLHLIDVRDVIRDGAQLEEMTYHRVYHPFAEALWTFRMAVRAEFGQATLTPKALSRANWLDYERCADCTDFR